MLGCVVVSMKVKTLRGMEQGVRLSLCISTVTTVGGAWYALRWA